MELQRPNQLADGTGSDRRDHSGVNLSYAGAAGQLPDRQRDARALVGRRRHPVGIAVRTHPLRLRLAAHERALRSEAMVPLRWRGDVLTATFRGATVKVA